MNELSKLTLLDETEVYLRDDAALHEVSKEIEGNPIELTDAADAPLVKCVTQIYGSQDLHGYDKPWVGGAGKNKFDKTTYTFTSEKYVSLSTGNIGTNSSYACTESYIPCSALAGQTITLNHIPSGNQPGMAFYDSNNDYISGGKGDAITVPSNAVSYRFTVPIGYASGDDVQIEIGSTATAYEPYSNICPITAYTEGEIEVRGKNLFDKDNANILTGRALNPQTGEVYVTSNWSVSNYIKIEPSTTYTLNTMPSGSNSVAFYDSEKAYISGYGSFGTKTTPSNAKYVRFDYKTEYLSIMQLEEGSTASTYEPYTSTTHTTTYPSAIYRGSEDVVKGEVTKEWGIVDLGSLTWTYSESTQQFRSSRIAGIKEPADIYSAPEAICEIYEAKQYGGLNNYDSVFTVIFATSNDHGKLYVKDSRYTDATAFASAVSGVKLAYKLATPTTSSVTPTNLPIRTLSPYSHIESSTGDVEVEYITEDYQPLLETTKKQIYEELPFTIKNGKLHVIYNK